MNENLKLGQRTPITEDKRTLCEVFREVIMSAAEKLWFQEEGKEEKDCLLIIDDSSLNGEIERNYFGSVGYDARLATNATQAEFLLSSEKIDILIVDVGFGGNKGLSMVKAALRVSANPHLRVLVSSIRQTPDLKKKIQEAGAHAFISKPAPRPQLLKEVKKLGSQAARGTERVQQKISLECQFPLSKKSYDTVSLDLSSEGVHVQISCSGG